MKRAGLWLGLIAMVTLIIWIAARPGNQSGQTNTNQTSAVESVSASDWVEGNHLAKTTLVEYSDLQCPACANYYPMVRQLAKDFAGSLAIAYRHFPLPQHQNGFAAAAAAEAAGKQGKFWEMHNLLFEKQKDWEFVADPTATFNDYAGQLGLDKNKFAADSGLVEIKQKISTSIASGTAAGVDATPTFFLNGQKITNPQNYNEFHQLISDALPK